MQVTLCGNKKSLHLVMPSVNRQYNTPPTYLDGYVNVYNPPGPTTTSPGDAFVRSYGDGVYQAGLTTDFQKKVKARRLIPHQPYYRFDRTYHTTGARYYTEYDTGNWSEAFVDIDAELDWKHRFTPGWEELDVYRDELAQGLGINFGENVIAMQQEAYAMIAPRLDALTALVESRKTAMLFVNLKNRAEKLLSRKRKGWSTAGLIAEVKPDDLYNARMEWRYGWRLLYYDICNAVNEYNHPLTHVILTGKSKSFNITNVEDTSREMVYSDGSSYQSTTNSSAEFSSRVDAAVEVNFRSLVVLKSPSVTMWEAAKFSFIADFFVSVGDALRAWEVLRNATQSTSSYNSYYTLTEQASYGNEALGSNTNRTKLDVTGNVAGTIKIAQRAPLGAVDFYPTVRLRLNSDKIVDIATVLRRFRTKS